MVAMPNYPENKRPRDDAEHAAAKQDWWMMWESGYDRKAKEPLWDSLFAKLQSANQLGAMVAEIGSGAYPVTNKLPELYGIKVIAVDIASIDSVKLRANFSAITFDVELLDVNQNATRKAISKVCHDLRLYAPCVKEGPRQLDSIVCSDILNYVDYRSVIPRLTKYLRVGGKLLIMEAPRRGAPEFFSPRGYDSVENLIQLLKQNGFVVESKDSVPVSDRYLSDQIVARYDGKPLRA